MLFLVCIESVKIALDLPLTNVLSSGGFLAGLIIPHDNGFAISIVEKIEDLVSILFLPIVRYLFISGNTSLD